VTNLTESEIKSLQKCLCGDYTNEELVSKAVLD
jgi:hypothetical protein